MPDLVLPYEPLLRRIGAEAARAGVEAYAVGGAVRDALLGRPTTDLDVVAVGRGIELAEAVASSLGGRLAVYPAFGTAAVTLDHEGERLVVEFVGARRESYRRDSRKPIVEDGTLAEDLARRDFTVNALAIRLSAPRKGDGDGGDAFGEIVDRFDGLADLDRRVLRTPLDPNVTFEDDPLRMLRAARFRRPARLHRRAGRRRGHAGAGGAHRDREPGADHRRAGEDARQPDALGRAPAALRDRRAGARAARTHAARRCGSV